MNNFSNEQPSVQGLIQRIGHELTAKAVLLVQENGQVIQNSGWIEEGLYPHIAALVAAMIAAGKSLENLNDVFEGTPTRFSCDSEKMGLYASSVSPDIWLVVLFDQPLNPGLFRMKVRKYSELLARIGVKSPDQWEVPYTEQKVPYNGTATGATMQPVQGNAPVHNGILTVNNNSLFGNITNDEIDELFMNARS